MNQLHHKASLSERAVQKVASENVKYRKPRQAPSRKRSKLTKTHWSDGLDPLLVETVKKMNVPQVWRRIQVLGPTSVIIHNNPLPR